MYTENCSLKKDPLMSHSVRLINTYIFEPFLHTLLKIYCSDQPFLKFDITNAS